MKLLTFVCSLSSDGASFSEVGAVSLASGHRDEEPIRAFTWGPDAAGTGPFSAVRFVRFRVEGTKQLPEWHASAGGLSWVFVDEIVVRGGSRPSAAF